MDVIEAGEWGAIGVGIVVLVINWIILAVVLFHRDYPPLKVKQLDIVAVSLLGGTIWWLGGVSTLRILPQAGHPVFLECSLWGIWLQLILGGYLWAVCEIFRFWRLYYIVKLVKDPTKKIFKLSFLVLWAPSLLYGIFATGFRVNQRMVVNGEEICYFQLIPLIIAFLIMFLYYVAFVYFVISLRDIKLKFLKEYQETRNVVIVFLVVFTAYGILSVFKVQFYLWGRFVLSLLILLIVTTSLFGHVGVPLYHLIVDPEAYRVQFEMERNETPEGAKQPKPSNLSLSHEDSSTQP